MIFIASLSSAFIMWYDIYFIAHRNEVSSEHWYPHIFQSKVCLVSIDKNTSVYIFIDKKQDTTQNEIYYMYNYFDTFLIEQRIQNFKASSTHTNGFQNNTALFVLFFVVQGLERCF